MTIFQLSVIVNHLTHNPGEVKVTYADELVTITVRRVAYPHESSITISREQFETMCVESMNNLFEHDLNFVPTTYELPEFCPERP